MRTAVREAFLPFTVPLEGVVPWMYLDVRGLVTTAIGILIDPVILALGLPFVHEKNEAPATRDEIAEEWRRIKARTELAHDGHRAAKQYCHLRLTDAGVRDVVMTKLDVFDKALEHRYGAAYVDAPADAQLAILSMSWACGPGFHFPALEGAIRAGDWWAASENCHINEAGNPGVKPRNEQNVLLFQNAEWVERQGADRDTLIWSASA